MTVKELIEAEVDTISGEDLQELYDLIRRFTQSKRRMKQRTLMAKLKSVAIDAPEDFAANHDLYIIGEKRA